MPNEYQLVDGKYCKQCWPTLVEVTWARWKRRKDGKVACYQCPDCAAQTVTPYGPEGETLPHLFKHDTYLIQGVDKEETIDVEAAKQRAIAVYEDTKTHHQKKQHQHLYFDEGPICLAFVGDQHIGNAGTDIKRMFAEAEAIKQAPNTYAVSMGDIVDNFIVGMLLKQNGFPSLPVREQWEVAKAYIATLQPIISVAGNHDAWTELMAYIDMHAEILPHGVIYDQHDVKVTLHLGETAFPLWLRHKWRGHSIYNPTHGQERACRFNDPNFKVYAGAHTHTGAVARQFIHEGTQKMAVQGGTYKMIDQYQRKQGFAEHDQSTFCAVIFEENGTMTGLANIDSLQEHMEKLTQ